MAVAKIYRIRENFNRVYHTRDELTDGQYNCLVNYFKNDGNPIKKTFPGNTNKEHYCLSLREAADADKKPRFKFDTSYFVGTQWLVENEFPVLVEPKFNKSQDREETLEIDYLKLMVNALQVPENTEHFKELVAIDFDAPKIRIEQKDDLLSPLLVIQFLNLLKTIVKKGLKNSYYKKRKNLKSRVRGKILVSDTVKHNHVKSRMLQTVCSYDEFGIDHPENRLLKKTFKFAVNYLQNLKHTGSDFETLDQTARFIRPAFQKVSEEIDVRSVQTIKPNPLFKEYGEGIRLAKLLLKRFGFNITETAKQKIQTPPFWIDMSKLFELHVLKALREKFPKHKEIMYQPNINGYYPDYLLKSKDGKYKMVIDAKYKNYNSKSININDIRQVSGYARMNGVYKKLGQNNNEVIDCLIIYPHTESEHIDYSECTFKEKFEEIDTYRNMFKLDIGLQKIKPLKSNI